MFLFFKWFCYLRLDVSTREFIREEKKKPNILSQRHSSTCHMWWIWKVSFWFSSWNFLRFKDVSFVMENYSLIRLESFSLLLKYVTARVKQSALVWVRRNFCHRLTIFLRKDFKKLKFSEENKFNTFSWYFLNRWSEVCF